MLMLGCVFGWLLFMFVFVTVYICGYFVWVALLPSRLF